MKYLELFTATVQDEPPENLTYHQYICFPNVLQKHFNATHGYAGFNIFDQRLADELRDRSGIVEIFQGYGTLDANNFEYKNTSLTIEDWEFFLDIIHLLILNKYILIDQIPSESKELFDLYWYHPGSCYFPGPARENLWEKCGVKSDHSDPWTLVTGGRYSAEPPQDWYIVLFPNISEDKSLLRYHSTVRARGPSAVRLLPKGWITQVKNLGNYQIGNSVDEPLLSESA